jgi:hypothetical protein
MSSGTDFLYNGIHYYNVLTDDFVDTIVRDQSDTDQMYHQYDITITSIANINQFLSNNPSLGAFPLVNFNAGNLATMESAILSTLQDRKEWAYTFAGTNLLPVFGSADKMDCNNGPRIMHKRIVKFSHETLRIRIGIRICLAGCPGTSATPPPILNNRWSQSDDYDDVLRCTRLWRGRLRLSTTSVSPQSYRSTVLPPLQANFRRKNIRFEPSVNGLELAYEITDEELLNDAPPSPAVKMQGMHSEEFGIDGENSFSHVVVRLWAPRETAPPPIGSNVLPNQQRYQLFQRAAQILWGKWNLQPAGVQPAPGSGTPTIVPLKVTLTNYFSDNENSIQIDGLCRKVLDPSGNLLAQGQLGIIQVGDVVKSVRQLGNQVLPDYDPDHIAYPAPGGINGPDPFGTAGPAQALVCALQTPCGDHDFTSTSGGTTSPQSAQPTSPPASVSTGGAPIPAIGFNAPPAYSSDQVQAPYQFAHIDMWFTKTYNRLHLPVASSTNPSNAGNAPTSAIVTLAPPLCQLHVHVAMERVDKAPELPADKDFVNNGVEYAILRYTPNPRPGKLMGNATHTYYSADAEYVWAMSRAPVPGETIWKTLDLNSLPWMSDSLNANIETQFSFTNPGSGSNVAATLPSGTSPFA